MKTLGASGLLWLLVIGCLVSSKLNILGDLRRRYFIITVYKFGRSVMLSSAIPVATIMRPLLSG
ncbi:MAG TPA: hypothetical protein DDY93_08800 [Dehalococcoidia bacterium]|nr:hypothetical protein [Chloroflexota bacterium]PCH86264.1 MAG: hypothetical protein COB86_08900 [Dehalococcoidia bacterium]HAC19254.1 hypothetical protein [Dehalococcoidia bacterium]HBJ31446.1 hypothetical protein [Dehalococcoidia bacterium]HCH10891.1 hypothetical protein [Dehalococcoidia bacterium]